MYEAFEWLFHAKLYSFREELWIKEIEMEILFKKL